MRCLVVGYRISTAMRKMMIAESMSEIIATVSPKPKLRPPAPKERSMYFMINIGICDRNGRNEVKHYFSVDKM